MKRRTEAISDCRDDPDRMRGRRSRRNTARTGVGVTRYFSVNWSGRDGSVYLSEINIAG